MFELVEVAGAKSPKIVTHRKLFHLLEELEPFVLVLVFHAFAQVVPIKHLQLIVIIQHNDRGTVVLARSAHIVKAKHSGVLWLCDLAPGVCGLGLPAPAHDEIVEIFADVLYLCHSMVFSPRPLTRSME